MTPEDSAHDKELLERYKRASDTKPAAPSEAVRAAILAEGRRVAEQHTTTASQQSFDVSRRAANDSRWKITAFGTAGAALVAALLFAPRLWENGRAPALQTAPALQAPMSQAQSNDETTPAASAKAVPKAESLKPLQQERQSSLVESAPAQKTPSEKKYAPSPARAAPSSAGDASAASAAAAPTTGYDQGDVSANRVRAARAKAVAGPSGLLSAAAAGDTLEIQAWLDQGAALDQRDELGRTPLMLAVIDGRRAAVGLLLARGADPNAADHSGRTPLQMARQANSREISALLEQSGARQNVAR